MENILCFVAHNDDEVIGCGATVAKYTKEGKYVVCVVFSQGEISHFKKEVISVRRMRESRDAAKILGYNNLINLGLHDGKVASEIESQKKKIKEILNQYKPSKIFTHSSEDTLPDHKAISKFIIKLAKELNYKEIYGFDVWNISKENIPKLYVDVSDIFDLKIKAMNAFKSQKHVMLQFIPISYTRAKMAGEKINCKYAEKFSVL